MQKALVPALVVLLVVIFGFAAFFLSSGPTSAAAGEESPDDCAVEKYEMGLKWQQQSAEARALQAQTYDFATEQLDSAVADVGEGENPAIITDLDETVIDNSKLLARDLAECHDYSTWDTWGDWERNGEPTLIPGALEFFEHADELGVDIFYISDRTDENKAATLDTLKALELPQVTEESVKLLGPPKEERRAAVEADHTVLMQLGDTLHDFDGAFADAPLKKQRQLVEKNQDKFGTEWIMLPNPTYGDWSEADLEEWKAPLVTD